MRFVHPEILYALGALAIPIIVHLFNFRKFRKILFSNVAFLKEIQVETQSKSKLKHLLILLARLMAVACIVFAFAQPYIPLDNQDARQGDRAISLYLDNSFSMEGELGGAPLLEIARNKAIEIAQSFSPTDKFQLLTNDFEGRHQRLVSRDEAIQLIQEVTPSPASKAVSEVYSRQRDILNTSGLDNKIAFHLTDLQASTADFSELAMDTSIALRIVPTFADQTANVFVDSVWFATPVRQFDQSETVMIRVQNTSDERRENLPVELSINGQQKGVTTVNIEPQSSADVTLNYTHTNKGLHHAQVKIDDYPITFDDTYFFGYTVLSEIAVMSIQPDGSVRDQVWAVFGDDPYFRFSAVSSGAIDYSVLSRQQLVILNQLDQLPNGMIAELEKFVSNGGSLCVFPSADIDFNSYNDLLGKLGLGSVSVRTGGDNQVAVIDYDYELFRQAFETTKDRVDLPTVSGWYVLNLPSRSGAIPVMRMRSDLPFLTAVAKNNGRAYFFSVPLDASFSSLTSHAFFPSSVLRMAELSAPSPPLSYTLGGDQVVSVRNSTLTGDDTYRLREIKSGFEFIPEHRNAGGNTELFIHSDLNTAGNYSLSTSQDTLASFGFNYDRRESDTRAISAEDVTTEAAARGWNNVSVIEGDLQTIGKMATELEEGKQYWWSMIIWALIFLAIEVLLIKYWRSF